MFFFFKSFKHIDQSDVLWLSYIFLFFLIIFDKVKVHNLTLSGLPLTLSIEFYALSFWETLSETVAQGDFGPIYIYIYI